MKLQEVSAFARSLTDAVEQVFVGKTQTVELAMVALLAGGHLLIEDVPGTGKTTLARVLAAVSGLGFRRVQFTPDLMPADIIGVNIYQSSRDEFTFLPGPVFTGVLLADEINRATPRTQAALLEAMQEEQVSVDGQTHRLPAPFLVIATQNPIEMDGTFRLPEAQLDRFLLRLEVGYPSAEDEDRMLASFQSEGIDWERVAGVTSASQVLAAQRATLEVTVSQPVRQYLGNLVRATRTSPDVRLGVSPRGALALQRAAQALAALRGRDFVLPDDIKELAGPVLAHRLILESAAILRGIDSAACVASLLAGLDVPMGAEAGADDSAA